MPAPAYRKADATPPPPEQLMIHYWGQKAILTRIGLSPKSSKVLYRYVHKLGLPCYLRVNPKRPIQRMVYSNEALISAWEWSMVQNYRQQLKSATNPHYVSMYELPIRQERNTAKKRADFDQLHPELINDERARVNYQDGSTLIFTHRARRGKQLAPGIP